MELFEFLRKFYQKLGIISSHSCQNDTYHWKTVLIFLAPAYFCISSLVSISIELNSHQGQIKIILDFSYWAISAFQSALMFAITISKMSNILNVIKKFEEIIQKSKCVCHMPFINGGIAKKCDCQFFNGFLNFWFFW